MKMMQLNWMKFRALALVLLFLNLFNFNSAQTIVKTLPGYPGALPFKLETGYVSVGENDDLELFYYFIESERDPAMDPLLIWISGGPGCSTLYSLSYEIGPLAFDFEAFEKSGSPSFLLNPYSWTKIANIIFLDFPVGTGFSYSTSFQGYYISEVKVGAPAAMFLRKWILSHPKFAHNSLYVGGDSYGGKLVPIVVFEISKDNEAGLSPHLNLEGYLLGNPTTNLPKDINWRVNYANRLGLISDDYFERAKKLCNGNYVNPNPENTQCHLALQDINECIGNVYIYQILEPNCPAPDIVRWDENFLVKDSIGIRLPSDQEKPWCRNYNYIVLPAWANDPAVQDALQVRKGTKAEWQICNHTISYDKDVPSVFPYHQALSRKRYQALVYSGDHDMVIPYISTLEWIQNLNLTVDDNWRPWNLDGQNAGYTMRYASKEDEFSLTFATIKGGGHTAPEFNPKECFAMADRWFSNYIL